MSDATKRWTTVDDYFDGGLAILPSPHTEAFT